jgi:hypothetical protein
MNHASGLPGGVSVERENRDRSRQLVDRRIKLRSTHRMLFACSLSADLHLVNCDRWYGKVDQRLGVEPRHHPAMGSWFAQLRNDVGIQEIFQRSIGLRCRSRPRGGMSSLSKRAERRISSSDSLPPGCPRRHSSIGTTTAVSTPRRVIICGPSFSARSITSLNFAFAS